MSTVEPSFDELVLRQGLAPLELHPGPDGILGGET